MMTRKLLSTLLLLSVLTCPAITLGQHQFAQPSDNVRITLQADKSVAAPGDTVNLVITLNHNPGWSTYWINPGTGLKTILSWTLPDGYETGETLWPIPKVKDAEGVITHAYVDVAHLVVPLKIPESAALEKISIKLEGAWQECELSEGCLLGKGSAETELTIGESSIANPEVESLAKSVIKEQARELDDWKVEVKNGAENQLEIHLTSGKGANPDPGKIYFFEASESPKLEPGYPTVSKNGNATVLKVEKTGEINAADVKGFLYAPNGWLADGEKVKALSLTSTGSAVSALTTKSATALTADDGKASYVTLDGKEETKLTVWHALVFAFLGGMILNLMPCVFPVLGLKVMGFVAQAGEDPKKTKMHGMVFAAGLILSLWVLAVIAIVAGKGWGFQLSSPGFMIFIILLLFILALNLFGVFEIGTSLMGVGGNLEAKKGYSGSFWSGVLTTIIATPCSGPFLGTAMGFTLDQHPAVAFSIFTALAVGIAFPYVVLSFSPGLISKLPKPGAWMDTFKKILAFPLLAAVIFFINSIALQKGKEGVIWVLLAMLVAAMAFWVYGHWGTMMRKKSTRVLAIITALAMLGGTYWFGKTAVDIESEEAALRKQISTLEEQLQESIKNGGKVSSAANDKDDVDWMKWSPELIRDLRAEGRAIFVDYTATW